MRNVVKVCSAIGLVVCLAGPVASQTDDYQQRMTTALTAAKRSADELNDRHKHLLAAIESASSPQQAQKFLDDLIASSSTALEGFSENSEMMKAVTNLLAFIDDRKRNAEKQGATDSRWFKRLDNWKAHGDNIRQLRQDVLKEADRAKGFLEQLKKDRTFIEDIIAGEGVARAKEEMEVALKNLRELGDSLAEAVKVAEERNKKISAPAS